MPRTAAALLVAALSVLAAPEAASQQLARQVTIRTLIASPPRAGQLLQVNGFLLKSSGRDELKSPDTGQKILLDFSQSSTRADDLPQSGTDDTPVSIIGMTSGHRDKGMLVIQVLGAFNLSK